MISLNDCVHRGVYKINSRNLSIGVFNKDNNGFIGIRRKFDAIYLDTEYHWDTGAPFGTVKPDSLICMLPEEIECKEYNKETFQQYQPLFDYLYELL